MLTRKLIFATLTLMLLVACLAIGHAQRQKNDELVKPKPTPKPQPTIYTECTGNNGIQNIAVKPPETAAQACTRGYQSKKIQSSETPKPTKKCWDCKDPATPPNCTRIKCDSWT